MKFTNTNTRTKIDRPGLVSIYERQFGAKCDHLTAPKIEQFIKTYGRCDCSKSCKEPLAGMCEFDHTYPNAVSTKGDTIDWGALTPEHHAKKTFKSDIPHIAKIKQTAKKYNPDYIEEDEKPKRKYQWAKRPMQSKNTPRYSSTRIDD